MSKVKICFICSSGGHLSELKKLKNIAIKYDSFLITEKVKNGSFDLCDEVFLIPAINRCEKMFIIKFLFLIIRSFIIFIKQKPNVLITTGALCAYPMAVIMKILRKKIIYIESYARVTDLSLTGKKMYKLADLFLVQWEELSERYDKAVFVGKLMS